MRLTSLLAFFIICFSINPVFADYQNPAFNRGMECMSHRDYDGAINEFGEAIGFNDTNPKTYLMRGKCFYQLQNYQLAIEDFNKSLQFAPNDSEAYLWRGTAHAQLGKDDFAIKDYEQAIKLDPALATRFFSDQNKSYKRPIHRQGQIVSRNGRKNLISSKQSYEKKQLNTNAIQDYKEAMAHVFPNRQNQALQNNPAADLHTDPMNNVDVSSDQSLNPAKNERVVKSLDTDPNRGEFGEFPGTRELRGDPQKMIDSMNDAINNDNTNAENYYKRAKAYQKLMNPGKAIKDYNAAIDYGPNTAKYYLGRASLFNRLAKDSLVQADIERARRCNPDLPANITFQGERYPESVIRSAGVPDLN